MAAPTPPNFVIDQDRYWPVTVIYQTSGGVPIDVTGWSATFAVAEARGKTPVITMTSAPGGGITITPLAGRFDIDAVAIVTNVPSGVYVCELVATDPANNPHSFMKGPITVDGKVAP